MRRGFLSVVVCVWLITGCGSSSVPAESPADLKQALELLADSTSRVAALENELTVIEERRVYVVLNPDSQELLLKVAGSVLKRIPVHFVVSPLEDNCRDGVAMLSAKRPTDLPQVDSDEGIVPRVRLEEMPIGYELVFTCNEERATLEIAPLRDVPFERMHAFGDRLAQRISQTLPFFGRSPATLLYLTRQSAQELYWALNVGDFAILR